MALFRKRLRNMFEDEERREQPLPNNESVDEGFIIMERNKENPSDDDDDEDSDKEMQPLGQSVGSETVTTNKEKRKAGRKANWSEEAVDELVDVVCQNEAYRKRLIFTNNKASKNLEIYKKIVKQVEDRMQERQQRFEYSPQQTQSDLTSPMPSAGTSGFSSSRSMQKNQTSQPGHPCRLKPYSKKDIWEKITTLFRTKSPLVGSMDFVYVKRERNKISTPATGKNFEWDLNVLKGLWGQGKLYCRLCVSHSQVTDCIESDESDVDLTVSCFTSTSTTASTATSTVVTEEPLPLPSSTSANNFEMEASCSHGSAKHVDDFQSLVNELLKNQENGCVQFDSLEAAMEFLKQKLGNEREGIRVSPTYALADALAYYKSDIDPTVKLQVQYKGQAAIDTGEVLRQFFSDVFTQMVCGEDDLPPLFEGPKNHKLPVHNAGTVLSRVLELVGKIIAHSIAQVGVGPNFLAPAVYKFFLTGEITESLSCLTIEDAVNPILKHYLAQIMQVDTNQELNSIYFEDDFQQLAYESGISQFLTVSALVYNKNFSLANTFQMV
eukprot:gene13280-14649_t